MRLTLAWLRDLAGRRAWLAAPIGALLAALLALDPVLGPEEGLGSYLAYVALLPAALLLRFGLILNARRRDGFEEEEALRDPRGARAPWAALGAVTAALGLGLTFCLLPPLLSPAPPGAETAARHPLRLSHNQEGIWRADALGAVPPGSSLLLVFGWERLPAAGELPAIQAQDGRRVEVRPGEMARWPLSESEQAAGAVEWTLNEDARAAGADLVRALVRLEVPRPGRTALSSILLGQFLFFVPLFAIVLLLVRRGGTGGLLAALSTLALAGLLAFDPLDPPELPESPAGWIGHAVLGLRAILPDLRGLAATGQGFELRSGTTSWSATAIWLLLGVGAACLARGGRRRS
jgi:hypothetical protein